MKFEEGKLYHVYNRGINSGTVFFSDEDYVNFLTKIKAHLYSCCHISAWCLMSNRFHLLVYTNQQSMVPKKIGGNFMPQISFGIKQLLSSYTKSLNRKNNRTGNLFQQKTKSKMLSDEPLYALNVFHYFTRIHGVPDWLTK